MNFDAAAFSRNFDAAEVYRSTDGEVDGVS